MTQPAENDACEVHVPGRDRPSPWCAVCRVTPPAVHSPDREGSDQ